MKAEGHSSANCSTHCHERSIHAILKVPTLRNHSSNRRPSQLLLIGACVQLATSHPPPTREHPSLQHTGKREYQFLQLSLQAKPRALQAHERTRDRMCNDSNSNNQILDTVHEKLCKLRHPSRTAAGRWHPVTRKRSFRHELTPAGR